MVIIGLTGGIASGKSTVAKMLQEKSANLIDADRLAREALEKGRPAWQETVDWLGDSILLSDGTIDRDKLGRLVFRDRQMLEKLNSIVHPRVALQFVALAEEIKKRDPGAVLVYDIPLLIEAGMQETVDLVLLVFVPRQVQLDRLCERDGISRSEAELRLGAQMPLEEKKKYAHFIIDNSAGKAQTARQVNIFWQNVVEERLSGNRYGQ